VVGPTGVAVQVGVRTPAGFLITREAAARLAGRLQGQVSLARLDELIADPQARRFLDAQHGGTIRIFAPSVTMFGGQGLAIVINPTTRTIVSVFPSSAGFTRNTGRFTEL